MSTFQPIKVSFYQTINVPRKSYRYIYLHNNKSYVIEAYKEDLPTIKINKRARYEKELAQMFHFRWPNYSEDYWLKSLKKTHADYTTSYMRKHWLEWIEQIAELKQ